MSISELILEESHRFRAATSQTAEFVFLGHKQMSEIDAMVAEMQRFGLIFPNEKPVKRATFMGTQIFRVDADSHLSFGVAQPSPCG